MAKGSTDLILRDRLQFTADAAGDQTTVYGRFDLSDFVSALDRKGLSIKEVHFQLRTPTNTSFPNTGMWISSGIGSNQGGAVTEVAAIKVYATTRAYENASDVGIASPDVLCIEQWETIVGPFDLANSLPGNINLTHNKYGALDLHPDGFPVVTDLLIGVASDKWTTMENMELDVMLIAEPISITQKQLTEMLVQGQDQ